MTIRMGPVLAFRGVTQTQTHEQPTSWWNVSILVVDESSAGEPNPLVTLGAGLLASGSSVSGPNVVLENGGRRAMVWEVAVPMGASGSDVNYSVGDQSFSFHVPSVRRAPRMAFASCNGFSDPALMKRVSDQNERWRHLHEVHTTKSFDLLLLGGDQIYGDELWSKRVPTTRKWAQKPLDERVNAKFTEEMCRQVERLYFDLYVERWSQPEVQKVLASIPTAMMWDDHDIFDGWGSHPARLQACDVFQGIFRAARDAFFAFQRQTRSTVPAPGSLPSSTPANTSAAWAFSVGPVSILGLDLRSERSDKRVMSPESSAAMAQWLERVPKETRHLVLVSSIPVVYADFGLLEKALDLLPGDQEIEDDLRDHWQSPQHLGERARLIHRLLAFSSTKNVRVTIVSGDVHVGALGVIESTRDSKAPNRAGVINQLISSGIVHPPPPGLALLAIKELLSSEMELDQGIRTRLLAFPNSPRRSSIAACRNWLSLEPDDEGAGDLGRLWANWHLEKQEEPLTKAIHVVGDPPAGASRPE